MTMSHPDQDLKSTVLEKIRTGNVHMRPKIYFVFKLLLVAAVAAATVIVAAWLVSFVIFSLRVSERSVLLGFGWRGIKMFLWLFPWRLLILEGVLIVILGLLLHYFRFGYRRPILYSLGGGILLSGVVAWIMSNGSLHETLLQQRQENNLPFIGSLYEKIEHPDNSAEVLRGVIVQIEKGSLSIKNSDDDEDLVRVLLPETMILGQMLHIGDEVFVAGELANDTLQAYGIQKVNHFHVFRKPSRANMK